MDADEILATTVYIEGANRPFGELTGEQVRARADELRQAIGFGPTARVAPVSRAWRELSLELQRAGAARVSELDPELLRRLAGPLWLVLPI